MDSLSAQKTKSRKIKKFVRKSRVQIIIDPFSRAIEIIVVLITIAKLFHQLVIAFEDSGVAVVILANRNLAFVVGNAIVIALIAKSGLFLNQELDKKCKSNDVYEEFVRERSRNRGNQSETETQSINETGAKQSEAEKEKQSITEDLGKQSITENKTKQSIYKKRNKREKLTKQSISMEIEKQSISMEKEKQSITEDIGKQSVTENKTKQSIYKKRNKREKLTKQSISMEIEKQSIVEHEEITVKENSIEKKQSQSYQRSQSENLEGLVKNFHGRLRRTETDTSTERFESEDELRYKIESFIARQRRNQIDD